MDPKIFLSPSIYTTGKPGYRILLRWRMLLKTGRYRPFAGDSKVENPCIRRQTTRQIIGGVMTKGLLALAHHCPKLSTLCVHLQVVNLSDPPGTHEMVRNAGPAAPWTACALTRLEVGATPMPERSAMIIALILLRIFPRLNYIAFCRSGECAVERD